MKKIISSMLVLMLVLTLMTTAVFATGSTPIPNNGSITINGIVQDSNTVYEVYHLLNLESYNLSSGAYSYKATDEWAAFFATDEAKVYFTTDEAGYVTWNKEQPDSAAATFAKGALSYAETMGIDPVQSSENDGEFVITGTSGVFSNLTLGYYLVDSSVGALCGLTTTNPAASINAKNSIPTIDKQVQEDSTGNWGDKNSADVGQTVNFRTTINVHAGAENYILHDSMSAGLTFDPASVRVELVDPSVSSDAKSVDAANYTVVTTGLEEGCTFEVRFTKDFCDSLETNNKVIVYYSAMLNRNAIVAADGNPNEAKLEFGENHFTTTDKTETYTFGIDIIKTDSQNTLIHGAEFKIYDAETGGNEVAVVLMEDNVTYRRARADEPGDPIVVTNGKVRVVGFDNGTYFLEETKAPDGYNKLTARQKFIISDANLDSVFNGEIYSSGSGVHVVNKTGSMLPETGGIGTLLFTVFGSTAALSTGVLLVTKKRMNMIEE